MENAIFATAPERTLNQFLTGVGIMFFGLVVGGVGVASAGIGIGIPMIPLGVYLVVRGARTMKYKGVKVGDKEIYTPPQSQSCKMKMFETTRFGGVAPTRCQPPVWTCLEPPVWNRLKEFLSFTP